MIAEGQGREGRDVVQDKNGASGNMFETGESRLGNEDGEQCGNPRQGLPGRGAACPKEAGNAEQAQPDQSVDSKSRFASPPSAPCAATAVDTVVLVVKGGINLRDFDGHCARRGE